MKKELIFSSLVRQNNNKILGIELKHIRNQIWACILPDASNQGMYRVQYYDKHSFVSHITFNTPEEALTTAITEGYRSYEPGSMDRLSITDEWKQGLEWLERCQNSWRGVG